MPLLATAATALALMGPPTPTAGDVHDDHTPRALDFELSGVAVTPTVTGPTVGPDMAVAFGRPDLHMRVGMMVIGGPDRPLSAAGHRVGEILDVGTLHMCAARGRRGWRIRMCGGGQLGVTNLRYYHFEDPGRRAVPWGALTGFCDLAIPLGRRLGLEDDRLGLLLQGGAMVPVLGPAVVMRATDHPPSIAIPSAFGATFGAGVRVGLR